ncbi:MAG: alpha/beta hydrolase [Firmicutes bacterium]|nr:alpha/beta hydrolase [Bacillota bacterium]MCL2255740.1 alpha/beta hydrolase [Bacillota bacterium]
MELNVNNLNIYYERFDGDFGTPILLLHGWGATSATMGGLFRFLKSENKSVISVDFPHFGFSDTPPEDFTVYSYADLIKEFLDKLGIDKVHIIAHSFGARVATILASTHPCLVHKLLLTGAAGCKPKYSFKKSRKIVAYKLKKKLGIVQKNAGSADYQALPQSMKKVFVSVVNDHLDYLLKHIISPTLIVFGKNDTDTPLYMARRLERKIKNSALVVLENAGHYAFLDREKYFCAIVNAFF